MEKICEGSRVGAREYMVECRKISDCLYSIAALCDMLVHNDVDEEIRLSLIEKMTSILKVEPNARMSVPTGKIKS